MLLFLFTLLVAAAGVGVYSHYNTGTMDVTVRTYHLTAIPDWEVLAVAAGVPLVMFLLHAMYSSARIRGLRRRVSDQYATGRTFDDLPGQPEPQPAPKRSWTTSRD